MKDDEGASTIEPSTPSEFAQTTPGSRISAEDLHTRSMIFELSGQMGELKGSLATIENLLKEGLQDGAGIKSDIATIKASLADQGPKIDDITGFIKHGAPHFISKKELGELKAEIEKRPTTWQAFRDFVVIVGLIGTLIAIASHLAH